MDNQAQVDKALARIKQLETEVAALKKAVEELTRRMSKIRPIG